MQNNSAHAPDKTKILDVNTIGGKLMGRSSLNEAEQNRLIQSHVGLVAPIAAAYRGRKGIPFEDLVSQGMVGLVLAARMWQPIASFPTYATDKIKSSIVDFIDAWQEFIPLDENTEDAEKVHWWAIWSDIPYEGWNKLPATPEEIVGVYQEFADKKDAASAAFMSLNKRERRMISARFVRSPYISFDQIARDHKLSYIRTVEIINRAVKKMRDVVDAYESKKLVAA